MRSMLCFAAVGIVALAPITHAQDPKPPGPAEVTRATYMVAGLHCAPCATTVEGSLKRLKGLKSVKVDFPGKYATVEFDETVISAQEVARAVSGTPHMMGRDMTYGGVLVLSVPGLKDGATGKTAVAALGKVEGVAKVTPYPQQQAVGVEFADKGKVNTRQLVEALEAAGLKGTQYGAAAGSGGPGGNERGGPTPDHAGMAMGDGGTGGHAGMVMGNGGMPGMSCGCGSSARTMLIGGMQPYYGYPARGAYYGPGAPVRGGCCR